MKALTKTNYRYRRVLEQFITAQGKIRARRLTNVSTKQHRLITRSIKRSRILARLPFMLSGILERKLYSEELKVVALESTKRRKSKIKVFSPKETYTQGSYPMTVARLSVDNKNIFEVKRKKRISRRTRIRTFDQVRLGLREDIRQQYARLNERLKSKSKRNLVRRGRVRGSQRGKRGKA